MILKLVASMLIFVMAWGLIEPGLAGADIDNMLDKIVGGVYVQQPGIYKSPSMTTMSLGAASFRLKNDMLGKPIFNFSGPKATLSCSGADFEGGMMSLLGLDQLEGMITQAGSQAAWGVMVGLVYSLPGVGEAWSKVQEFARELQKLSMQSCAIGKAVGQTMGSKIWPAKENKAIEEKSAADDSPYSQALKQIQANLKVQDMFQTIPYSSLGRSGINDSEIRDLIASWFGIIDIYLRDGVNGTGKRLSYNAATKGTALDTACSGPCGPGNVDSNALPPQIKSLEELLNGGSVWLYSCSSLNGEACGEDVSLEKKTVTGLRKKIKDVIINVRVMLKNNESGANLVNDSLGIDNSNSSLFAFARMLPNFLDVLNYSAILEKSSDANLAGMSDTVVDNLADLLSYALLTDFIKQARTYIGFATGQDFLLKSNVPGEIFNDYLKSVQSNEDQLQKYADSVQRKYQMFANAFSNYKSLREYGAKSVMNTFGRGVVAFGK